tara:strand:- start:94 stop:414 length:321 start_codon:yes stop_codon:yes gene_type:complete
MENTTSNTTSNAANKEFEEEIGALWKRKSKNGLTYLAGHVKMDDGLGSETTVKVVLFSNKKKTNEKQPDFRMYVSKAAPRTEDSPQAGGTTPTEAVNSTEESEDLL